MVLFLVFSDLLRFVLRAGFVKGKIYFIPTVIYRCIKSGINIKYNGGTERTRWMRVQC